MGYSTCTGYNVFTRQSKHFNEVRSCDGCDRCPSCDDFRRIRMYCWRCCGLLTVCPDCAPKIAAHVLEAGKPTGEWAQPDIMRGYRQALRYA